MPARKTLIVPIAAFSLALSVAIAGPTLADSKDGPVVRCSAGQVVGAYSSTTGPVTYQSHRYTSTSGSTVTRTRTVAPAFHSSTSPYQNASTRWLSDAYITNWSNRCE